MTFSHRDTAIQAFTSIGSHNELQLLCECCEAGVKKACRNGAQICEMVLHTEKETGTIDLRGLESIAERMTELKNAALLYMRLRETLTPDSGNAAPRSTRELDSQIAQVTDALVAVEDRIRKVSRMARNRTTN